MKKILGVLCLACLSGVAQAQTCGQIPFPMGLDNWEEPLGNNDLGVIVGKITHDDFDEARHGNAFVRDKGVVTLLPGLRGQGSAATAININGQAIGYATDAKGRQRAVTWIDGAVKRLPNATGSSISFVNGINSRGSMVGSAVMTDGGQSHAVRWRNGKVTDLNRAIGAIASVATAINSKGQIVGWAQMPEDPDYTTAFLYEAGVVQFLPDLGGHDSMYPAAINENGQIVGQGRVASRAMRGFFWSEGTLTALGSLDGRFSWATGINNDGKVVGTSSSSAGNRAFIWKNGVMKSLGTLPDTILSEGNAINNKGQVVGISVSPGHIQGIPWRWKRNC